MGQKPARYTAVFPSAIDYMRWRKAVEREKGQLPPHFVLTEKSSGKVFYIERDR